MYVFKAKKFQFSLNIQPKSKSELFKPNVTVCVFIYKPKRKRKFKGAIRIDILGF